MIQPPYTTGTATVTAGSAVVNGTNTAWILGLVSGGLFTRQGLAVPILSVQSNTQLTLAYSWPGATGTGSYAIDLGRADAASAIVANRRLLEYLDGLAAMSPLGAQIVSAETSSAARAILQALGLEGGRLNGDLIVPRLRVGQNGNRTIVFENAVGEPRGYLFQDSGTSDLLLTRADGVGTIRLTASGALIDGSVIETRARLEQYLSVNAASVRSTINVDQARQIIHVAGGDEQNGLAAALTTRLAFDFVARAATALFHGSCSVRASTNQFHFAYLHLRVADLTAGGYAGGTTEQVVSMEINAGGRFYGLSRSLALSNLVIGRTYRVELCPRVDADNAGTPQGMIISGVN